jgi:hypothetical protein
MDSYQNGAIIKRNGFNLDGSVTHDETAIKILFHSIKEYVYTCQPIGAEKELCGQDGSEGTIRYSLASLQIYFALQLISLVSSLLRILSGPTVGI